MRAGILANRLLVTVPHRATLKALYLYICYNNALSRDVFSSVPLTVDCTYTIPFSSEQIQFTNKCLSSKDFISNNGKQWKKMKGMCSAHCAVHPLPLIPSANQWHMKLRIHKRGNQGYKICFAQQGMFSKMDFCADSVHLQRNGLIFC